MNENKKTVKRVLVLDAEALLLLQNWIAHYPRLTSGDNAIGLLDQFMCFAAGTLKPKYADNSNCIEFNFGPLFWKAYSKEVSE